MLKSMTWHIIDERKQVWFVIVDHFERDGSIKGKPIYGVQNGYYLGTYPTSRGMRHIITTYGHITTTVVDHIPDSRTFDDPEVAADFADALNRGVDEVKYEDY